MVKTPRTRHSKTQREPLTIDLEPGAVSRVEDAAEPPDAEALKEPIDHEITNAGDADQEDGSTEAGTAAHPEQEYQTATSAEQEASGHDFESERVATPDEAPKGSRYAEPPVATPAAPARDGFSRVLAGILGGMVALALAGALQYFGVLGSPGTGSGSGVAQSEVDALKQEVAGLRDAGSGASDLAAKVDRLAVALDTARSDILSLQQAVAAAGGGENAGMMALDARVKQIEASISALNQGDAGVDSGALAALSDRLAAVEAALKAGSDAAAAGDTKLAALEAAMASLTARVDAQAAQPKIALAIATAALKSAVDRGAPFTAELETFAAIAPQAPEIPALRALAEKGVSSRDDLVADMDEAAAAMIAAAEPVDQDAGFFERLLDSAESLVTVRPIGSVEGTGVSEIVARVEMALIAGNLEQAVVEYDSLPDTAKAAGADFAERLKARLTVEKLVDQAIAGAMKA